MSSDNERKGSELDPGLPRLPEPSDNMFLESGGTPYQPPARALGSEHRPTEVDDTIRALRNLSALVVLCSAILTLVAYFLLAAGVPPWFCLAVAFTSAPLTIWVFGRTFAALRRNLRETPPSRRPPAQPHEPDEAVHPGPEPSSDDLLTIAESTDTPQAAKSLAMGLDTLFRTLGPPPEVIRLAQTGPAQGDGGSTDG